MIHRQVKISENKTVFSLLKEAAEWLQEKNIDYWQNWHNPTGEYIKWIEDGILNNEFRFVEQDRNIVGMYRMQFMDELFWGNKMDNAVYIHSFTVKRSFRGKGIGVKILEYIETEMYKNGIDFIRLDCEMGINGLCKYYEEYGFNCVGTKELSGYVLSLYEKRVDINIKCKKN